MSVGICCQWIEETVSSNGTTKLVNALEQKNLLYGAFQKGKYSNSYIISVYLSNLDNLLCKLPNILSKRFTSFRMSSNILPLIDQVPDEVRYDSRVIAKLSALGSFVINNKIRFTTHPDQFCVLSSKKPEVIKNSFRILDHHAWMFDQMALPKNNYYCINIHGGVKGQFQTLVDSINRLPLNVKSRLSLENDELAYSVEGLYQIYKKTGVSTVFDSHHHNFNPGSLSPEDAMNLAISTWKEKPLTHLSNTEPGMESGKFQERRKHSNYVHYIPEWQLNANNNGLIDIDFEFKMKNVAAIKAANDFQIKL